MAVVLTSSFENILRLISVLVIFVFVLFLTYITTRWIANYQKEHSFNRNLEVVETLKITPNKYIQIVRAGEEYLVIAIGKDEVQLLTRLTKEQLAEVPVPVNTMGVSADSFKDVLESIKKRLPKK
ncbi:MAG: flagellar biosynthetic protein FliO [Lachnospiraceae bacterium]|nr:flagellar biosynthetic protein FliO [Lachnospiraceae bacterium]